MGNWPRDRRQNAIHTYCGLAILYLHFTLTFWPRTSVLITERAVFSESRAAVIIFITHSPLSEPEVNSRLVRRSLDDAGSPPSVLFRIGGKIANLHANEGWRVNGYNKSWIDLPFTCRAHQRAVERLFPFAIPFSFSRIVTRSGKQYTIGFL